MDFVTSYYWYINMIYIHLYKYLCIKSAQWFVLWSWIFLYPPHSLPKHSFLWDLLSTIEFKFIQYRTFKLNFFERLQMRDAAVNLVRAKVLTSFYNISLVLLWVRMCHEYIRLIVCQQIFERMIVCGKQIYFKANKQCQVIYSLIEIILY